MQVTEREIQRENINKLFGTIKRTIPNRPGVINKICPCFIFDVCPYELLKNTRESMGECPKLHIRKPPNDELREECKKELKKLIDSCDERIYSNLIRNQLINNKDDNEITTDEDDEDDEMEMMIKGGFLNKVLNKCIDNGNKRDIELIVPSNVIICEICGASMLRIDTDRRLIDHFGGKLHRAYADMRNMLKE